MKALRCYRFEILEFRRLLAADSSLPCPCIHESHASDAWLIKHDIAITLDSTPDVAFEPISPQWSRIATRCRLSEAQAELFFAALPGIHGFEPDVALASTALGDPRTPELYAHSQLRVEDAWNAGATGDGTVVAVLDTGVDISHPDLADNLWSNPREVPGNGIDDDANGYVDDVSGWDFFANDASPMDEQGHGTHVAGTIAAVRNNAIGVAGVAPDSQLLPVRFLGPGGSGNLSDAVRAISYVTDLATSGTANVVAINASWGSYTRSRALEDAIAAAGIAGILFVAASGNSAGNNDELPFYPASYDSANIISVASTDIGDNLSSFSNVGPTSVDIAAPGSAILSTDVGGGYRTLSGTSMAAPHVSGVVALLASQHSDLSAQNIRDRILATGTPLPSLRDRVASGMRLSALGAVLGQLPSPLPPEPTPPPSPVRLENRVLLVSGTTGNDRVVVSQQGRDAYVVSVNAETFSFRWFDVFRIEVHLDRGDDFFQNDSDLPGDVFGGDGNDTLIGGESVDRLFGELGDDLLLGREGPDVLRGGPGRDELRGGKGFDELFGGAGRDVLIGGRGSDVIHGDRAKDKIDADGQDTVR